MIEVVTQRRWQEEVDGKNKEKKRMNERSGKRQSLGRKEYKKTRVGSTKGELQRYRCIPKRRQSLRLGSPLSDRI
jgi:hypothetical protein